MTARNIVGVAVPLLFAFASTASAGFYTFEDLYPGTWQFASASDIRLVAPGGISQSRNRSLTFNQTSISQLASVDSRASRGRFRAPPLAAEMTVIDSDLRSGLMIDTEGDSAQRLLLYSVALILSNQTVDPIHHEPVFASLELGRFAASPPTPEPTTVIVLAIAGFVFFMPRR